MTLKLGTLVFVSVGCYRMLSTPLNNVLVTMRHVTTLIHCELRIVAFRRSRTQFNTQLDQTESLGEPIESQDELAAQESSHSSYVVLHQYENRVL